MLKGTFLLFLVVHILCDFYFQTETVATKKEEELRWVMYHTCIYGGISFLLFAMFLPGLSWKYTLFFVLSHGIIDILKFFWHFKLKFRQNKRNMFVVDQTVHFITIFILVYFMSTLDIRSICRTEVCQIFHVFGVSEFTLLSWTAKLLLIHKPANILIAHILSVYKPVESTGQIQVRNDKNAGRLIGTLERVIMVLFISLEQYSAVGLVLTAKSIARYDRITKEQDFAEYYLLGTLLSTIYAVSVSVLI